MKATATKSWGPVYTNTFSKVYAFVVIENALIDWRPHYRFDAFSAVHAKTFQSDRITRCDVLCWTLSVSFKHTQAQRCLHLPASWYQKADFWQTDIFFGFVLSEYVIQSHNLTNSNFCDVTLLFSIQAFLNHAYIFSFFYFRLQSVFRGFRCTCTLINI